MMTNYHRPCTLWGQTFDASKLVEVHTNRNNIQIEVFSGIPWKMIHSPLSEYRGQRDVFLMQAITTIAEALNAPIKLTQAVLDAMNKVPEAKFNVVYVEIDGSLSIEIYTKDKFYFEEDIEEYGEDLEIFIQADCPLALQVLLGFTTEGVPVNGAK
jgi:hypothetical protein